MADGIYSALSGALSRSRFVDTLSHNISNQSTDGYRQFRAAFEQVGGAISGDELSYSALSPAVMDTHQGTLEETGNPMDIALSGGVYLSVIDGGREAYTRGGTLMARPDGLLVDSRGRPVLGVDGPAKVPPGTRNVAIGPDGSVLAEERQVDTLRLVEFADESALQRGADGALIAAPGVVPLPAASPDTVMGGFRESSNFDVLKGITDLISAQRGYEATLRAVETFSRVDKKAANELARA